MYQRVSREEYQAVVYQHHAHSFNPPPLNSGKLSVDVEGFTPSQHLSYRKNLWKLSPPPSFVLTDADRLFHINQDHSSSTAAPHAALNQGLQQTTSSKEFGVLEMCICHGNSSTIN
ncbi:hypothetical protein LDENG_00273930 [Lucifuga dentata]|nr:hypothetical protein LDENG_00273930 [Lucifuga dentata]